MNSIDPARLVAAHHEAVGFYRHHLIANDNARQYLATRGLRTLALPDLPWHPAVDKPWRLGYAPATWTSLTDHLVRIGYTHDELLAAGLTRQAQSGRLYDTFRDRIVFPIRNPAGEPVAFTGRRLHDHDERIPKYLNTPNTAVFHKGQTLYGLAEQADQLAAGAAPVLVEGPLDVIAVWLAHPHNAGLPRAALAACGTNLSPAHIDQLLALAGARRHGITTAYDPDSAGNAATERIWQLLHTHHGIPLWTAALTDGTDPADLLTQPAGTATLREALTHRARPLAEALIDQRLRDFINRHGDRPDSPELRVAAVRTVADLLTHVPPTEARRVVEHVASLTGATVETVTAAVIAALDREDGTPSPNPVAHPPPTAVSPPVTEAPTVPGRGGHTLSPAALRPRRHGRR